MSQLHRRIRERLDRALSLSNSLLRYAAQDDTPPQAAQIIRDRAPFINIHLIDALHAVVKLERKNRK